MTSHPDPRSIETVAEWLAESSASIAVTGAGISTESGIPDFRSPGGIWSQNRTIYYEAFVASQSERDEYWRQKSSMHREFADAKPNAGHRMLSAWEQRGRLLAVITQNIDGLHQLAGQETVLELHGTAREVACLDCHKRWPADEWVARFLQTPLAPACPDCGGPLKHATVSFGQALPEDVLTQAFELANTCQLCLTLGSSLVVHPAASIPQVAQHQGAKLVIINQTETPLDGIADIVIRAPLGQTLTAIDQQLSFRLP